MGEGLKRAFAATRATRKPKLQRFWISWEEKATEDYRPTKWPLKGGVVAYWCSGYACYENKKTGEAEDRPTLCAVVDAKDEAAVKKAIKEQGWTPVEWRFVNPVAPDYMPGADRFPPPDYIKKPKKQKRA